VGVGTQGGLINLSAADYRSRPDSISGTPTIYALVAKLVKAHDSKLWICRFESDRGHHLYSGIVKLA